MKSFRQLKRDMEVDTGGMLINGKKKFSLNTKEISII